LKRAAGVDKASSKGTIANLDRRYIYEVAKVKSEDPKLAGTPLRLLFRMIMAQARTIGIKIL
jgi:large subunit ribosomal protein L11